MTTGEDLRNQGWTDVQAADTAVHRGYADLIRDAIDALAKDGIPFTAEDARRHIAREHPEAVPHSANLIGSIFGAEARSGRIQAVGLVKTGRASRRASMIRAWVGAA